MPLQLGRTCGAYEDKKKRPGRCSRRHRRLAVLIPRQAQLSALAYFKTAALGSSRLLFNPKEHEAEALSQRFTFFPREAFCEAEV